MRVPISWLKEYVDITLPLPELAERLTLAGLEVGTIHYLGVQGADLPWDRDKILVGHILAVKPHPNAERLVLADVDYGAGHIETVVTGAPNLFPYLGQDTRHLNLKSPFALEGVTLYDGHKTGGEKMVLKGRPVRGIMNRHMLCSEKELGISDDHEGILLLDPDTPVGVPLVDLFGTAVLDIDLTPNMARCASIVGIAREVAALTGQKVRYPDVSNVPMHGTPIAGRVAIETTEPPLNPRFCAALIEGITIKPSPFWMQLRLRLAGMRPINNIVDVSNYVMLEIGQPNHAFDYDVLRARADDYAGAQAPVHIITRLARPGERLTTLDGVERVMEPFTMLVTDPAGPLSIGGIMGGAESEVHAGSQRILLEAAAWDFINIRRSIKAYGLPSEAGYRFSRGVHPSQAWLGVLRGAQLMQQLAGGCIAQGIVDYYPAPAPSVRVDLPMAEVRRLLGIDLSLRETRRLLEALEFTCEPNAAGDALQVTVPDHRMDIGTGVVGRADLVEEVARIYGYDRIPTTQIHDAMPPQRDNRPLTLEQRVKQLLVEAGLQEVITYRMTTPEREEALSVVQGAPAPVPYVEIANPITPERRVMRRSLLAGVLEVMAHNVRQRERVWLFEVGPIFLARPEAELPDELERIAIALTGPRRPIGWQAADVAPVDFFDLKGIVEALLEGLHVSGVKFEPSQHVSYWPGRCALLKVADEPLGVLGQLHPAVVEAFDMPGNAAVLAAELDLERLMTHVPDAFRVRPVPRFPAVRQDIALVVDEDIPADRVQAAIREAGGRLLADARLFDVYRGEQIGPGKKSLAYTLTFQADDRTLTDKEVAKQQARIVRALEEKLGARLRG